MSYRRFKKFSKVSAWIIVFAFFVGCDYLPNGLEDQKRFKSNILAGDTLSWIHLGAKDADLTAMQFTNRAGDTRRFRYQTNIVVEGVSYESVLRFECAGFRGRGYLVAVREGTVIWVGSNGKNEITYPPKH
jgi:hypothetical protein